MAKTKSQLAFEKINKKYGIQGTTSSNNSDKGKQSNSASSTRTNDKGKQSNSASSTRTNTTVKTKSQLAFEKINKKYGVNADEAERFSLEKAIGFDTINDDLTSTNTTLDSVYKSWQDKNTMSSSKASVEKMYNRLKAYDSYRKKYGNDSFADISDTLNAYKGVLDNWENLSNSYGQYTSGEEYSAKQKETLDLIKRYEDAESKTTEDYYNKRYQEELSRLKNEHANDYTFPVAAHADSIVYAEMQAAKKEMEQIKRKLDNTEGGYKDSWFKGGAFADGYDFGDTTKTTLGTVGDLGLGIVKGVGRLAEGLVDLGTYGVAGVGDLLGADEFAEKTKDVARYSATDEWTKGATNFLDKYSVLGNKADAIAEGLGQVAGIIATGGIAGSAGLGSAGVSAVTTGVTGLSSMGTNMGEAYNSGATDGQAFTYGLTTGAIEAGTELLFGGLGKGVKALGISRGIGGLDDMFAKKVSSKIVKSFTNESVQRVLGNTIEASIKAGGEGFEELLAGAGSAVMKKLTYMSDEELSKLIADENLLEQFIVGTVVSSIAQSPSYINANRTGTDLVTGLTFAQENALDKIAENEIAQKEADGKKLTNREKNKIYSDTTSTTIDTLEQAAKDVVANRSKQTRTPALKRVEAMSINGEAISVEDAKQATGYGENGAKLLADTVNSTQDKSFSQVKDDMHIAYLRGWSNENINITDPLQKQMYNAGKMDRIMQDADATAKAKEATVYDDGLVENENFKKLSKTTQELLTMLAKDHKLSVEVKDSILAAITIKNGREQRHYANASHDDGRMELSMTANKERPLFVYALHEDGHRMEQMNTPAWIDLCDFVYARAERLGRRAELGVSKDTLFDKMKSDHDNAEITLSTRGYVGEVVMRELETVFRSEKELVRFLKDLDSSPKAKNAFARFMQHLADIIKELKWMIEHKKLSKEGLREAKAELAEMEHIKELYGKAYLATRDAVAERAKVDGKTNTESKGEKQFSIKDSFATDGMTDSEIKNAQNVISNLKSRAVGSKYVDGYASYTVDRIEREIRASSSSDVIDYAKSYVAWVSPIDFVYATTTSEKTRQALKDEAGTLNIEKLKGETQPIHLTVDFETGEIVGHEGRHRMLALQQEGIDNVAIIIDALNDNRHHTKPIEFMSLTGQRFQEHRKGLDMFLHDMLPLSQRYADVAREVFTNKPKSGIQYSLKDSEGNTLTEAQAEFFKDSKIRDKDGNLLVVYHGTPNKNFNVFSYDYVGTVGGSHHGYGFYFSDSKKDASLYAQGIGDVKAYYINITNPIDSMSTNLIGRLDELFARIPTDAKNNLEEKYGGLENAKRHYEEYINKYKNGSFLSVFPKNADISPKLFNLILGHLGYDGIIHQEEGYSDEYVVFYSDQSKLTSNTSPTLSSDVRFSLKGDDINKLSAEEQKVVNALGKGAKTAINKNGDMLIATNKSKSTIMYSLKTYEDGGKEALEKALRANGHTEAEIEQTIAYVDDAADYLKILAAGYAKSHNYTALSNHLIADVIVNVKTGKQVISSIVNNGEYPVNIDLALICKKRVAYMNLMNRLIDDGIFDKVNYGGEAIAKVNDLLRMDGFETACLGCFVESRRLQFQAWAETIVSEWNAEVDKRKKNAGSFNFADGKAKLTDAEMDALAEELKNAGKKNAQGNLNLGQGSVQTKMGRLLDKVPSLQKHLTVADLLTPDGLTALRAYDSNLFSIVKSRYGAASPKIVQDYNPYASEISMMTFASVKNITSNAVKGADAYRSKVINEMGGRPVKQKGETTDAFKERKAEFNTKVEDEAIRRYLYDIGGARIQSFSDFMIENAFDYIQIFADLSAKRLPLHGYTKEIIALRLFGMTGAKWNGSWIAHTDRKMGKEYAGLLPASEAKDGSAILVHTKDGDFAIGFDDYARYKATNKKTFIQSIGMKDMIALQLDPRYSSYVGSITIGVSDKQILAMLDSPFFRFIIPYHSSGMLPQFAKLVGVDLYNDYTDYQNTTIKQWYDVYGNPCGAISDVKVDTSYNFNAEVQKTGDAKKAANNYLKWCGEKHPVYDKNKKRVGYVTFNPKFSNSPYGTDFSKHENYYKMLEDFNSYDNITEKSAVQGAVTMNFPSEQNRLTASEMEAYKERLRETGIFSEKEIEKYSEIANKTFKELIADEVKGRAEYQQAQSPKWENTVKNVEQMLLADHKRESFSLKGGVSRPSQYTDDLLDTVEDLRNGKKNATSRLDKYVKDGTMSTEAYTQLIEKYGAIATGEKPHREIQVPRKTENNKKVSQTVRTILEAKATPDEALPTIEKMVEDGIFSYDAYTDKQAIADANDYIKEYGWDESLDDWFDDVEKGIVSKQHTAMGWALYNNAVNTAATTTSESEKTTAIKTSLKILDAMVRHQRSAAQALQATRILKKLSPETQLYAVQKSVSAFQKELTDKYGDKAPDLKIDKELAEQFINAKTPEERAEIEKEIYKDIGRQMPSRFIDKWNAWRYLAMLGNLRTHGRNILGNAFFAPVVVTKNMTASAIESVVNRVSSKKMVRGKAIITGNKADRQLLKVAWGDYGNVADMISNGGKYNDSAIANQAIEDGRQIFKTKPLEWARKKNSALLEVEDMWFAQPHYAYALAQYCKANNITAEQIQRGKAIAPARDYAIREAQKATYRDTNAFSQMVSSWGRSNKEENVVKKAFSTVIEGILPFRKTPANILVRGVEYSPIGLLKGLSYDLVQVSKGKMSATDAIDNVSAGLTGTGLLALGVYLAAQGLIRGHGEDDKDEKEFNELMGHQAYALELPNGQSITLDWLAPEALPFFVGVNIWESTKGSDEELNFSSILKSVSNITEPMLEMSCLQSLNDLFESVGYASSNDTSGLISVLSSAVTSYLTQGIPTLLGQAERTAEEERMTTYTEKNGFLTGDMQYTLGKASAKIPFWDYNQIPYIDAWGRKEASGTALKRGLNNFLNPAYTSTIESSKMEKELLRLYEKTGETGVFPSRADKYFQVDGKRKDLTAEQYVRYATLKGQKSYKLVSDLVKSSAYKKLSDEEKIKAIEEAYDYANQKAKKSISSAFKTDSWVSTADEFGSGVGNYLAFRADVSDTRTDNGGKISKQEVIDIALDMAQNDSEIWKMYLSEYDSKSDMYAYDKGVSGEKYMNFLDSLGDVDQPNKSGKYGTYTQDEAYNAIKRLKGLSQQEKAILWQSVNTTWKKNPFR